MLWGVVFFVVFIAGTAIGSFLNVVILRYKTGQLALRGGSYCFSCNKKLKWYELIPILSFVIQNGKCRGCGSKISLQYPLVELTVGTLFLLVFLKFYNDWMLIAVSWLLISLLIIIAVYDLRHKIIPNLFVYLFIGVSGIWLLIENLETAYSLFAGLVFAAFFAFLWLISKGKWMGFGDAKLALGLGWFLGVTNTFSAFLFSFWLGSIVGILLIMFKGKKYSLKSQIPFGPFLVAGSLIALFLDFNIFDLIY